MTTNRETERRADDNEGIIIISRIGLWYVPLRQKNADHVHRQCMYCHRSTVQACESGRHTSHAPEGAFNHPLHVSQEPRSVRVRPSVRPAQ